MPRQATAFFYYINIVFYDPGARREGSLMGIPILSKRESIQAGRC